jgi:hypothetical protein
MDVGTITAIASGIAVVLKALAEVVKAYRSRRETREGESERAEV